MLFVENPFPLSLEIYPKCHGLQYIVGDEATYLGPCNGGVCFMLTVDGSTPEDELGKPVVVMILIGTNWK